MEISLKRKTENPVLELKEKKGVFYLTFPKLDEIDFIVNGFSTRLGGVSKGIFSSMNLSFNRGDSLDAVMENFQRMASALEVDRNKMVYSKQTHTTNLKVVTEKDWGKGIICPRDYDEIDGLLTNVPGTVLVTSYADCVPLYFVDTKKRVIALSHSGWKGTVNRMGQRTVERMKAEFGCRPKDLTAAIGPSICADCYEIGADVAQEFLNAFGCEECREFLLLRENGKFQLDLWKVNQRILEQAGIPKEQISVTDVCTCCNQEYLFSHRASKGKRGNLGAFLALKPMDGEA